MISRGALISKKQIYSQASKFIHKLKNKGKGDEETYFSKKEGK